MTAEPARRTGPRQDLDVPAALVRVAERRFGQEGVDAVSLRAVARDAGVAPAALSYHFTTKTDLVAAVVRSREGVGRQVRARLTALLYRDGPVRARDVVDALLLPLAAVIDEDPVGGLHWMKVFVGLGLTDDPIFHRAIATPPSLEELFAAVSARAMPHHGDVEVRTRVSIAMFSMLTALAGADLEGYGHPLGPDGLDPVFVDRLAGFTAAGLEAALGPEDPAG